MSKIATTIKRNIGRSFLRLYGWKIQGTPPQPEETCIFVGAPHTSGFDAPLMLAVAWRCNLRVKFLIKREITDGPYGWFWKSVGGIPVDRENPGPLIDMLVAAAHSDSGFQLVLTPEGTRKPVNYWKSGFYRFALAADIPLALVSPDKPTMTVNFGPLLQVTSDVTADMDRLREFFDTQHGVNPENRRTARLRAEEDPASLAALLGDGKLD
jgi:1-acyl-sn-glycerol-3-phosphate acyltransferase